MGQLLSIPRWREEDEMAEGISETAPQLPPPPYIEIEGSLSPIFDAFTGIEKRERPPTAAHPAFRDVRVEVRTEGNKKPPGLERIEEKPEGNLKQSSAHPPPPAPKITLSRIQEEEKITSKSTPQWRWNNQQCRLWLACVLVDYGGKSQKKAKQLASEFEGWGPNLYLKTWSQWCEWLDEDGQAIYALLMQEFNKEGAVPKDVTIQHYLRG